MTPRQPAGALAGLGRQMHRFRWPVIALWLALVALAAWPASGVNHALKSGGFVISDLESQRAYDRLKRDLHVQGQAMGVVFQSPDETIDDPAFVSQMASWSSALEESQRSALVEPGPISADRHTAMLAVYGVDDYDAQRSLALSAEKFRITGPARVYLIGSAPFYTTVEEQTQADVSAAERRSLPVALIFLLLIFGGLIAAGMPVMVGLASVTFSLAALSLLGHITQLSIFAESVTTMLGLGIGIDYSLIIVNRFREERRVRPLGEAVAATSATAGRTVVLSGITVVIGFSALALSGIVTLRSMGLGGMIVVAFSLLVALTLVPAVLGVLGPHIDRFALPRLGLGRQFWSSLAEAVMRRPITVIAITTLLVVVIALPARGMNINLSGTEVLPGSDSLRQGEKIADASLGIPRAQPVLVALISSRSMTDPSVVASVHRYESEVAADPEVGHVTSYVDLLGAPGRPTAPSAASGMAGLGPGVQPVSDHTGLMVATFKDLPNSPAAAKAVERIRGLDVPSPLAVLVGGEPAFNLDWTNGLYKSFPWIIAAVLGITYLLLMIGFRSILLPLKAIVMNLLSIAAAYGAVTFIFEDGHLTRLLNFEAQPSIESTVPIVMFAGLFGLSMDYEVFLLSRVAEEYRAGNENKRAVALGMERTGRIITSAALVMVIVFGFFALSAVVITKEIGLGFAIAVLVDATVIRLLMVPAWMRVFGRWNWWFPRFRRLD